MSGTQLALRRLSAKKKKNATLTPYHRQDAARQYANQLTRKKKGCFSGRNKHGNILWCAVSRSALQLRLPMTQSSGSHIFFHEL
jgi:hypothetical protein